MIGTHVFVNKKITQLDLTYNGIVVDKTIEDDKVYYIVNLLFNDTFYKVELKDIKPFNQNSNDVFEDNYQ